MRFNLGGGAVDRQAWPSQLIVQSIPTLFAQLVNLPLYYSRFVKSRPPIGIPVPSLSDDCCARWQKRHEPQASPSGCVRIDRHSVEDSVRRVPAIAAQESKTPITQGTQLVWSIWETQQSQASRWALANVKHIHQSSETWMLLHRWNLARPPGSPRPARQSPFPSLFKLPESGPTCIVSGEWCSHRRSHPGGRYHSRCSCRLNSTLSPPVVEPLGGVAVTQAHAHQ
ncbi:hypothetical protein CGRA01v4_05168 [Colletotrichum graminicola]|nr:hypothetical protein CGRA01v4_05168 [Colletotrichum graminicola]